MTPTDKLREWEKDFEDADFRLANESARQLATQTGIHLETVRWEKLKSFIHLTLQKEHARLMGLIALREETATVPLRHNFTNKDCPITDLWPSQTNVCDCPLRDVRERVFGVENMI